MVLTVLDHYNQDNIKKDVWIGQWFSPIISEFIYWLVLRNIMLIPVFIYVYQFNFIQSIYIFDIIEGKKKSALRRW